MTQHLITTTMQPGNAVWVTDEELLDLERMGVVADRLPTELSEVPAPTPLVGKTSAKGASDGGAEEEVPEADGGEASESVGG